MIEVDLPRDEAVPAVTRSFAACVASVTETPIAEVPQPQADLVGAISHWRSWLAGRGAGLVTLAKPATFNWPGYWLAVLGQPGPVRGADELTAVLMFGTPSGVVLSPQDPDLLGRAATDLSIREGYVVCGLDPAFIAPRSRPPKLRGRVEAIAPIQYSVTWWKCRHSCPAGWIRTRLAPSSSVMVRADLDRFVTQALIPERVRMRGSRDPQAATTEMQAEWQRVKDMWP